MAHALERQIIAPDHTQMSFEDRLGLMIQHEITERASFRLVQRLRWARLPVVACLEDLDTRTPRGLDPADLHRFTDLASIREHLNVLITGPTGVGKSLLGLRARSRRLPCRLLRAPHPSAAPHRGARPLQCWRRRETA
jgi:DNA replication protein DnaC